MYVFIVDIIRCDNNANWDDLKTNASIWAKGTYSKGTQEVSDIYSLAYDSYMFGAIVGAEFGLGESLTVGAAGSYTQTTVTYKGLRTDKEKFKSIYGSLSGFAVVVRMHSKGTIYIPHQILAVVGS